MRALLVAVLLLWVNISWAAITLDRDRVIFNASEKSLSVTIINTDKSNPFLVQSWIEDEQMNKLPLNHSPLIVLPPVMRLDGGKKTALRITSTSLASRLPADRESLLYLNVREVPRKKPGESILQVALQTTIKVLYRPQALKRHPGRFNGEQLRITREGAFLKVDNPTPYYFTVVGMSTMKNDKQQEGFNIFTLKPFDSKTISNMLKQRASSLWVTFINDLGGRPQINIPLIDSNG